MSTNTLNLVAYLINMRHVVFVKSKHFLPILLFYLCFTVIDFFFGVVLFKRDDIKLFSLFACRETEHLFKFLC